MKKLTGAHCGYRFILAILVLLPCAVQAQLGDNAVWASGTSIQGSGAFVDAAAFCGSLGSSSCSGPNFDFCAVLKTALSNLTMLSPPGGIVDARGVVPAPAQGGGGGPQKCNSNPFFWNRRIQLGANYDLASRIYDPNECDLDVAK